MRDSIEVRSFLGMQAIVASVAMKELLELVERVAATSASVLIQGESGSGKELVARAIHAFSPRSNKPWVDVSCAALPEHLIESELFGYEKGAFSGADSHKPGLFELANQGTLFLDEIGELEPKMQVKLLRVLDGVPYFRLGGVRKIVADVRIVAATNQDLEGWVESGRFRGDLFHRLSQISIRVPPLRERVEDIVPLAEHFLAQTSPGRVLTAAAAAKLRGYSWPGNIRELRNAVIKAGVATRESVIEAEHLPFSVQAAPKETAAKPSVDLGDLEKRMIFQVLAQTGGHQQKAATLLGISRRTLSRKLKTYQTGAELHYAPQ